MVFNYILVGCPCIFTCYRSTRKPTGLFISDNNVTVSTAVKRLQDLIGLWVNYNRDSPRKGTLLENSGGNQSMGFPSPISDRPKNCSQEINDKKDIQFHGVVINNRPFNLIHFSSRRRFRCSRLITFKVFKGSATCEVLVSAGLTCSTC